MRLSRARVQWESFVGQQFCSPAVSWAAGGAEARTSTHDHCHSKTVMYVE